jgi:predicted ABC-type ATPase
MAFHINPSTGETGLCKAEKVCPFGGPDKHFATSHEARAAYEKTQEAFADEPFAGVTTEELEKTESAMLREYRAAARELTDEEYDRHYEYIRRIRKGATSTHKQFTKTVKGKAVYLDERLEQHDRIVQTLSEAYKDVANEGRVLVIGGITGAGKTTAVNSNPELQAEQYASVNPDDVKIEMVKLGMTPEISGVLPLETDELIKYEAGVITDKLYDKLSAEKKNLVIDRTMARASSITKTIDELKSKGYSEFAGVFVDVDPDEAYGRIRSRHHKGLNHYLKTGEGYGERPVPGSAIAATRTDDPNYRSSNAKVFVDLVDSGVFTKKPKIYDSSAGSKEISFEEFKK